MTAAPLPLTDPALKAGVLSLVCRHLPFAVPELCSQIDPTPLALSLARTHYDALTAGGPVGLTATRERLTALGVATTTAVAKALHREVMRETMWRNTGGAPFGFAG